MNLKIFMAVFVAVAFFVLHILLPAQVGFFARFAAYIVMARICVALGNAFDLGMPMLRWLRSSWCWCRQRLVRWRCGLKLGSSACCAFALAGCASWTSALTAYNSAGVADARAAEDLNIKVWTENACGTPLSAIARNPTIAPALKSLCLSPSNTSAGDVLTAIPATPLGTAQDAVTNSGTPTTLQ